MGGQYKISTGGCQISMGGLIFVRTPNNLSIDEDLSNRRFLIGKSLFMMFAFIQDGGNAA